MNIETINSITNKLGAGMLNEDAATLALVAMGMQDGALKWDDQRAEGKGGFVGNSALVKAVLAATDERSLQRVEMAFTPAKVNKVGNVVRLAAQFLLDEEPENLFHAAGDWLGVRTLTSIYNELKQTEPATWTLSGALATVVAKARKEGIEDSVMVETLIAILSGE